MASNLEDQIASFARELREAAEREEESQRLRELVEAQLQAYVDDLRKIVDAEREQRRRLEVSYYDTILRLARASAFRDDETQAHAERLGHYARVLARAMNLPSDEEENVARTAPLHDIGKIGIPDAILHKPGPLDADEWRVMKTHAAIGASLLKGSNSPLIETARQVALSHHENWDGSGYPQGLAGEKIPMPGRIVKLVDIYDALRSRRPYKDPMDQEESRRRILEGDGRVVPAHFDPDLLRIFPDVAGAFDEIFDRHRDEP